MADRAPLVLDASAMIELLLDTERSSSVRESLRTRTLTAPAHFDAEVMSAIGRLRRNGDLSEQNAAARVERLAGAPIRRAPLAPLLAGAWARRGDTRLTDALYIELAHALDTVVITTDLRLAREHPDRTHFPGKRT